MRSGFFAVAGRPNVGKSTLVNALCGGKVAIVSDKPQKTRRRIAGVVNGTGYQLVLVDLPGFQKPLDAELDEPLPATAARGGRDRHRHDIARPDALGDRAPQRAALCADAEWVGGVLDVHARDHAPVPREHGRADPEVRL